MPELPKSQLPASIYIRSGIPPEFLSGAVKRGTYMWEMPGRLLLNRPELGRILVEGDDSITFFLQPGADPNWMRLLILGTGLSQLLMQRGYVNLHGNACQFQEGAVIFAGAKGAGKSTLSAVLDLLGRNLLADDLCPVRMNEHGEVELLPAVPRVKLLPAALHALGLNPELCPLMMENYPKHGYIAAQTPPAKHVPLKLIAILAEGPEIKLEYLHGAESLLSLERNLCYPKRAWNQGRKQFEFELIGAIARGVPLVRLTRPFNLTQIREQTRALIETLEEILVASANAIEMPT